MKGLHHVGLAAVVVVLAGFAESRAAEEGNEKHPEEIPGLLSFWDFQGEGEERLTSRGKHAYRLKEMHGKIENAPEGVFGDSALEIQPLQWMMIEREDCPGLNLHGEQAVTMVAWIKRSHNGIWQYIAGVWNERDAKRQYALFTCGHKQTDYVTMDRSDCRYRAHGYVSEVGGATEGKPYCFSYGTGKTVLEKERWHMIAFTYDQKAIRVYVDGRLDENGNSNPFLWDKPIFDGGEEGADFTVAQRPLPQWPGYPDEAPTHSEGFAGLLGGLAVYDRSLTDEEIAGLYQATMAQEPVPTWELGTSPLDPEGITGQIDVVDGVVKLDGSNAFSIPASALGEQKDYTIEFEVKRPADVQSSDKITLLSNTDETNQTGLGLKYYPPSYNAFWLMVNGHRTVEYRGFLNDKVNKVTIVAKDGQLMLFRNSLLLATTAAVEPSSQPLVFGKANAKFSGPYEISSLKIYDTTVYPPSHDPNAKRMRYYGGEGYSMQRVELTNPDLPRILVIGDSISGGYRGFLTERYQDQANIDYWLTGYLSAQGDNSPLERALTGVLSNGPYDAVTFNFGLHWWPHDGRYSTDEKYVAEMTKVVALMQKVAPETKFIWNRTTPWRTTPEDATPTLETPQNERIMHVNQLADRIMNEHGIPTIDLYSIAAAKLDTITRSSKDSVHWPRDVSALFATEMAEEIDRQLQK